MSVETKFKDITTATFARKKRNNEKLTIISVLQPEKSNVKSVFPAGVALYSKIPGSMLTVQAPDVLPRSFWAVYMVSGRFFNKTAYADAVSAAASAF